MHQTHKTRKYKKAFSSYPYSYLFSNPTIFPVFLLGIYPHFLFRPKVCKVFDVCKQIRLTKTDNPHSQHIAHIQCYKIVIL